MTSQAEARELRANIGDHTPSSVRCQCSVSGPIAWPQPRRVEMHDAVDAFRQRGIGKTFGDNSRVRRAMLAATTAINCACDAAVARGIHEFPRDRSRRHRRSGSHFGGVHSW